jgi:cytochrome c-type biogenesis protein CcmF
MAAIGTTALLLTLIAAVVSFIVSLALFGSRSRWRSSWPLVSALVVCGLLTIAVAMLLTGLLTHNFSMQYVAEYGSTTMSVPYLVSAIWAGNGGSLLFWAWVISLLSVMFAAQKRNRQGPFLQYAMPIIMVAVFFFSLTILRADSPFVTLASPPADGSGLNPLLENPGMIFHPLLLLVSYAAFVIPFALAVAALWSRKLDDSWLPSARRWTLFAWLALGLGNLVGMWWAYVELGWGGYWAWDPVENSGFMPWLLATAFLHSMIMQKRRGTFKMWNVALIAATFNLVIFGTFMTRGGFSQLHSFADTGMAPYFITFLAVMILIPFGLIVSRRRELKGKEEIDAVVSRDATFFLNNILLVLVTLATFIGSVTPGVSKLASGTGATQGVDKSFFIMINVPILMAVIVLAGICALIGWRKPAGRDVWRRLVWPIGIAIAAGIVLVVFKVTNGAALTTYVLSVFAVAAVGSQWLFEIGGAGKRSLTAYPGSFVRLLGANRPRYGAYIVHISLAVVAVGIAASSLFKTSNLRILAIGESMDVGAYTLTYQGIDYNETGHKGILEATLTVTDGARPLPPMKPAKIYWDVNQQWYGEVAIRSTLTEDLYVILSDWDHQASTATFEVLVNPLVDWIWIGAGIFMLGGLISWWPGREAPQTAAETIPASVPVGAAQGRPAGAPGQPRPPAPAQPSPAGQRPASQPARPAGAPAPRRKKRHGRR